MDFDTMLTTYTNPRILAHLANAVAVDYFRKLGAEERPTWRAKVEQLRPDVAAAVARDYPQHWF